MFDEWLTYREDNENSVEDGSLLLSNCPDSRNAFMLSRALLQNPKVVFELYGSVLQQLNSSISNEQIMEILDVVISRGFDLVMEHADTISSYMTCIPSLDATKKPLIRVNLKYAVGSSNPRRTFLLLVKILHEVGHAFTPYAMKKNQPELESVTDILDPKLRAPENVGVVWFQGRYIGDCGFAVEESIFGGRVVAASVKSKWATDGPLHLQTQKFLDLPLAKGNFIDSTISDDYIVNQLTALKIWSSNINTMNAHESLPSLKIPSHALTMVAGNFEETKEKAEKLIVSRRKRKRALPDCDKVGEECSSEEEGLFDESSLEYQDLVSKGLALTSEQYNLRITKGVKF